MQRETGLQLFLCEQKPGLIKTELDTIQFNKANVALATPQNWQH